MKKLLSTGSLVLALSCSLGYPLVVNAKMGEAIQDSAITATVKAKMAATPHVSALDFNVETEKGIVFLRGDVKTQAEVDTAIIVASSTDGVVDVDVSGVTTSVSHHHLADSIITAKVKGAFVREKAFGHSAVTPSVTVETTDGIVSLTGEVDHKVEAENLERIAKSVKGVREVRSSLQIKH